MDTANWSSGLHQHNNCINTIIASTQQLHQQLHRDRTAALSECALATPVKCWNIPHCSNTSQMLEHSTLQQHHS
jgi:hypothetical protein